MAYAFASAPTIAERVAPEAFQADDSAIGVFSDSWTLASLENNPIKATGAKLSELRASGWQTGGLWFYHDDEGRRIAAALRLDNAETGKKQVLPLRVFKRVNELHWVAIKALDAPRPLYNLHHLAARPDAPVLMVEGEKAAGAGTTLFSDHVTTTWLGGAAGVANADLRPLAGRHVVVWPDNDDDGLGAADRLGPLLAEVGAASVRVVRVPAYFPRKWDVADAVPSEPHG